MLVVGMVPAAEFTAKHLFQYVVYATEHAREGQVNREVNLYQLVPIPTLGPLLGAPVPIVCKLHTADRLVHVSSCNFG